MANKQVSFISSMIAIALAAKVPGRELPKGVGVTVAMIFTPEAYAELSATQERVALVSAMGADVHTLPTGNMALIWAANSKEDQQANEVTEEGSEALAKFVLEAVDHIKSKDGLEISIGVTANHIGCDRRGPSGTMGFVMLKSIVEGSGVTISYDEDNHIIYFDKG